MNNTKTASGSADHPTAQPAGAQAAPELTETAVTAKNPAAPVSSFEDSRTQAVYEVLVNDNYPPAGSGEHWEGWKARLIVDALFPIEAPAAVAGPSEMHEAMCPAMTGGRFTCERNDPAVDKAWARFCGGIGDGPDAPYPGMISAFERYYSQSFTDKDWRNEASVWAAAWKQAMLTAAAPTTKPAPVDQQIAWFDAFTADRCGAFFDKKLIREWIGQLATGSPYVPGPGADAPMFQAAKLPERDASIPAEQQGMFRKFDVRRVDGSDQPGGKHHGCTYFVLDLDHDPCARPALAAYAAACESTHPALAADLRTKWGAQPVVRKPLTDEQIQNLLGFGDPTEQEKHLIRLGRDAAHGITTTGRKDAP